MNSLIAALMMLGPWASTTDALDERASFARAIFECAVSVRGPIAVDVYTRELFAPEHGYALCADNSVS